MATKKDRQRKLARERYERREAREAQRQARNRQLTKWASAGAVVVVLAVIVTFTALHLSKSKASSAPKAGASASSSASASPSASPSVSPSATTHPSPAANGTVACTYVPGGQAAKKVGLPPRTASVKGHYQATITTNRGTIVIDLTNSQAPCTVNSFVFLAEKGYFTRTPCHRLTTSGIYVLQCGDPTGTGSGGPGYQFGDENLAGATYPAATVAMANSGANTNGSQFFLVYKNTSLPPSYTPFGTIVNGLNVIQAIAKAGTDNATGPGDGHPKEKVTIESVTIKKT